MTPTRRLLLFGLMPFGVAWMATGGRDLLDRAVPVLSSVAPLETWVLTDAKYNARVNVLHESLRQHKVFDLIIIGDSHAQYVDDRRLFPGINVLNLGIARDTTVGVLDRLGMIPKSLTSPYILVEIGYNDLKYRDVAATAENIARIVAAVRTRWAGKADVLVQGLFPVKTARSYTNREIRKLNSRLQVLCNNVNCTYVDVMRHFSGPDGGLEERYTKDGVHLNEDGNRKWIALIRAQLKY